MTSMRAVVDAMGFTLPTGGDVQARDKAEREEALAYLRSKGWEDAPFDAGFVRDVLNAKRQESACAECRKTGVLTCPPGKFIPLLCREEQRGYPRYSVRYGHCPVVCEREARKTPFERLVSRSRLSEKQRGQTFEAFSREDITQDIRRAFRSALGAADDGGWLALGGLRGTGKSHLAAAIALSVMRKGQQAYFRLVSEMLDDLRRGYEDGTYDAQMRFLKNVPCLVLDDMGKERGTEAAHDYLHQIIDSRYRERKQVIITTNARSKKELSRWSDASFLAPLISRMDEMGDWVFIADAEDYRVKLGKIRRAA